METKLQLPTLSADPPLVSRLSTACAVVAGIATIVGVSSLHKHARRRAESLQKRRSPVHVGLLRMHVPQTFCDVVKNDVLVEKAVELVAHTLVIFVSGRNKHEVVTYTSELYGMAWDVACTLDNPLLDLRYGDAIIRAIVVVL